MNTKKELHRYIIVAIVLTILPIILYILKFWRFGISGDTQAWGVFGDFLAGATGPALAILNLIVLVRLTLSISDYDNQRMLTELRFETYKEFMAKLNEVSSRRYCVENVDSLAHYLEGYSIGNYFLLEGELREIFSNIHLELYQVVYKLKLDLKEYAEESTEFDRKSQNSFFDPKQVNRDAYMGEIKNEIEDLLIKYDALKFNCSGFLHRVVAHRSIDDYKPKYLKKKA